MESVMSVARHLSALSLALVLFAPSARAAATAALADTGLFAPVAAQYRARLARLETLAKGRVTPERIRLLIATGGIDEAYRALPRLTGEAREVALVKARALLARQDFAAAAPLFARLAALEAPTDEEREAVLAWLFAHDDAARVDALTRGALAVPTADARVPDLLAAGRLACSLMQYARAESCYWALERSGQPQSAQASERRYLKATCDTAFIGLAQVKIGYRDWNGALAAALEAVEANACADAMIVLAQALLRVGRTDEAISAAEWASRLNPYSEMAHYLLGNGYTVRRNYTQLVAAWPDAFADAAGRRALAHADSLFGSGVRRGARAAYEAVHRAHPGRVDVLARLASLDFEDGRFDAARDLCFAALRICPEYGRAHAILAKALQFQRFDVDVHRPAYEAAFAREPMPDVPDIERFVVNWRALSPRIQKRVALSIAPWRAYVPVLLAGGADFYVKPMYMLLSEVPGQQTLKDQRISYDSRLWDDVRGSGGYHTVTGIEDVEATIFARYNTVLHELTHQVHAVLTADQSREIQDLYRRTKALDEQTHDAFLSRYAAVAVEEYLAEGANALFARDRDAYDPRPEVRSRLERKDPALKALVERLMATTDVSASYPVAYVNAGDDRVGSGRVDEALGFYQKALELKPDEEYALLSFARALDLGNRDPGMLEAADRALAARPASGAIVAEAAEATWHGGRGLDSALALARAARPGVRTEDRLLVDLEIARLAWARGDAAAALTAADSALARQSDSPEGLRARASSLALASRWDEAFAEYDKAVRLRTGVVDLRCDYAFDLLRAGRLDPARHQLDEAKLLDEGDPNAEALRGLLELKAGDVAAARTHAQRALRWASWSDLARIVLGAAERKAGAAAAAEAAWAPVRERIATQAPPRWVYRKDLATWQPVHQLPAIERELLEQAQAR
jgi:tetratricopeptide (TPR) repeat protein